MKYKITKRVPNSFSQTTSKGNDIAKMQERGYSSKLIRGSLKLPLKHADNDYQSLPANTNKPMKQVN